jgi:DNA-binding response OmpR family regulator
MMTTRFWKSIDPNDRAHPPVADTRFDHVPKILLIINYQNLLDSLSEFLIQQGYSVYGVSSVGHALEVLQIIAFDFVICDNYLPDICGLHICQQIKKWNPNTQFLLMSSIDDKPLSLEASNTGISHVFHKPINLDQILDTLIRLNRPH